MGIVGIETWAWCRHQVWWSDISVCSMRCTGHGMSMGRQQECARKTSGQMRQTCERASHIASWLNEWWFLFFFFFFFFFYDERSSVKIAFHQHLWCDRQGTRYRGFHCELDRPTHCPLELVGDAKRTACVMVAEYSMQLECVLLKSRCRKNSHCKGCSGWKARGSC